MVYNSRENLALEIKERAGIEIDMSIPQVISAQCVVIKSSYLLFPAQGKDGVLYVDKSNKEIYIYDTEANDYQSVTKNAQNLVPMTDKEVDEKVEEIINATKEKITNNIKGVD